MPTWIRPRARHAAALRAALLLCLARPGQALELTVQVRDGAGQPIARAVVALHPVTGAPPAAAREWLMDQVDKRFVPALLAIRVGDRVNFPNSDDIRHHVYSFSPAKTFELPLYHGIPAAPVTFERAGKVVLGCNIHDRMAAHVYVLDTPWFAVTENGSHRFDGLAPGDYEAEVLHPAQADAAPRTPVHLAAAAEVLTLTATLQPPRPVDDTALSPLARKFKALRDAQP